MITRFELWHSVDGEIAERLGLYEMETRDEDEDPADLVQEIWSTAVEDTSTRPQGSFQRYTVKSFRGDKHEPDEAKSFSLTGSAVSSAMGGTESPTPRGYMAQEMRQNDNLHGMMMRMAEGSAGQLAQQLREAREENEKLILQRSRLLDIEQRLLDRSHEREMDRAERAKSGERMDMVLGMLTTMAPLILGKLLEGKPLPGAIGAMLGGAGGMMNGGMQGGPSGSVASAPEGNGPPSPPSSPDPGPRTPIPDPAAIARVRRVMARDEGLGNLLGTLKSDQVQQLASILRPDQAMGFLQIYQDFHEEHQERAQSAQQQPSP
jgi:hypothetical protein